MLVKNESINVSRKSLTNFMNIILEKSLKFSFQDYLKKLFCFTSKKMTLYSIALNSIKNIMEIKTFIRSNLEAKLIKKVLFDKNQLIVFDTISLFSNFKSLFDDNEKDLKMFNYDKKDFQDFFESLNILFQRENATDRKLLNFIKTHINE